MQVNIGVISRCSAGGNHWHIPVTINGVTKTLQTTVDEMQAAAPDNIIEGREQLIQRIRSALLEAGAATWAQAQTALNNKTFQI